MEAQTLPDALKMIMEEEGWNQTRLSREMGVLTTWVSKVIKGQRDTPVGNAIELLGRVGYELVIRRKSDEAEVKRRSFLANVATVALVPSANGNPYRDPEYVSMISERVSDNLYGTGGLTALQDATRHLRRIQNAITGSKDTRLLRAASSLAREVSLVQYDAREISQAQVSGKLAVTFAQAIEDREGQANALNELAMFYCYEGDGQRGQQFARRALTISDMSPEQEATAYTWLGRALGLLNEKRSSVTNLDKAQEIGTALPDFQRANLLGNVGVAFHDQGEYTSAQDVLHESVKGVSSSSPWLGANLLARQVQAALRASQPDLAVELMASLGRVAPLVSSARLDDYLSEILSLSAPWRDEPDIKSMRQQLRHLLI